MIIAIDGPAASGKGTLGRRLAAHYGFRHLDTGLLYRAVAKAVLDAGADDYIAKPASPKSLRARIEIAERRVQQAVDLRAAESDLARARWLAGIGETALAMEREIGGPLEIILERSLLLIADESFNDDHREQLGIIRERGMRLSGVISRAVSLQSPQSVEYLGGARMIDLSGEVGGAQP